MITVGSVSREDAARWFPFLSPSAPGRRTAMRDFTHRDPEFVFLDLSRRAALRRETQPSREPAEGLRAHHRRRTGLRWLPSRSRRTTRRPPLIVVYCRSEALAEHGPAVAHLLAGLSRIPSPIDDDALVVSDNADIYGTVADLAARSAWQVWRGGALCRSYFMRVLNSGPSQYLMRLLQSRSSRSATLRPITCFWEPPSCVAKYSAASTSSSRA